MVTAYIQQRGNLARIRVNTSTPKGHHLSITYGGRWLARAAMRPGSGWFTGPDDEHR